MSDGWIKVHRRFCEWEWYSDANTVRVFLHLLLKANHKDKKWRGSTISRGQLVTSYGHLATEIGLSVQKIRTAISKLKSTSEITIQSTSQFTVITLCKYDTYQSQEEPTNKPTNKQSNKRATNEQQTNNNNQECKNEKKEKKEKKMQSGGVFFVEENGLSPAQRKQNLIDQHRWAIKNGLIKSK